MFFTQKDLYANYGHFRTFNSQLYFQYFDYLIIVLMLLAIEVANMYLGYNVNAFFI